jgi:hypothetical protein
MPSLVNVSGTWRDVSRILVNVSGTWRNVAYALVNVSGTWRQFFGAGSGTTVVGVAVSTPSSTEIDVSWSPVTGASTYDIYRNTTGTAPSSGTTPTATGITTTSYFNTSGISQGVVYWYWVRAVISSVAQSWSTGTTAVTLITPSLTTGANTSTGFSFTLNNYFAVYTWTISATNGATVSPSTVTTGGTYVVSGLASGASSTVTITALYGTEFTATGTSTGTAGSSTTAPVAPTTIVATVIGTANALIAFTDGYNGGSAITSHNIYPSPAVTGFSYTPSATSPIVVGGAFAFGVSYAFSVTASNAIGTSAASTFSSYIMPNPPAAPGQASIGAPGSPNVTVISTVLVSIPYTDGSPNGSAITDRAIAVSPSLGGLYSPLSGTPITWDSTPVPFAVNQAYSFTVASRNSIGLGPYSTASNSVTPLSVGTPSAPTLALVGINSGTNIDVYYSDGANGGSPIVSHAIVSSPSVSLTYTGGTANPINVTGSFIAGQAYTFTIAEANAYFSSVPSAPSSSYTPNPGVPPGTPGIPTLSWTGTSGANWTYTTSFLASSGSPTITYYLRCYGSSDSYVAQQFLRGPYTYGAVGTFLLPQTSTNWKIAIYATNAFGTSATSVKSNFA